MKFSTACFLAAAGTASAFAPQAAFSRQGTSLNSVLASSTGQSALDPAVQSRYDALPFPDGKILAEYVWVDAKGETRSKTRTLPASKVCSLF